MMKKSKDIMNKSRLIILADMGNEPDEEQQMIHMLMCNNEFDLDGLIAVTGKYLKSNPMPELFHKLHDGYEMVFDNLNLHANGWHSPQYLHDITKPGQNEYGMADVGDGKSSPGSEIIVKALQKDDPRPIYVVINAGSNTLAQALWDCKKNFSEEKANALVDKLRVFENGAQDDAGAWICHSFPEIHWMRSNYQTYAYGGPGARALPENPLGPYKWQPFAYSAMGQHHWTMEHIKVRHGPLGALYPLRQFPKGGLAFMEGGGTVPWLGLLTRGLYDPDHPSWGGWSGRFTDKKIANYLSRHNDIKKLEEKYRPFSVYHEVSDSWTDPDTGIEYNNIFAPVWRWRTAMYNNIRCRMDWCIKPYNEANHHPQALFNGDKSGGIVFMEANPGEEVLLDASGSTDPDGDALAYCWWVYAEAGSYAGNVEILEPDEQKTALKIPHGAYGKQIHVILELKDKNNIASLYDYRRIIINVLSY